MINSGKEEEHIHPMKLNLLNDAEEA